MHLQGVLAQMADLPESSGFALPAATSGDHPSFSLSSAYSMKSENSPILNGFRLFLRFFHGRPPVSANYSNLSAESPFDRLAVPRSNGERR
jgi:hypothetical protein